MTALEVVLLAVAGLAAGVANTVAGGGTFISYPVLLAMGLSPITANVTSAVGLISGYLGGSLSYRRELSGQGPRVLALAPTVVVGAVAGAVLLLLTPGATFETIVPFLVLAACLLLVVQPRVKQAVAARRAANGTTDTGHGIGALTHLGVLVGAAYGTYFGAGLGVVLLAVLGIFVHDHLQRINGLRTTLSLAIKVIGVAIFLFSGQVSWWHALVLAVTAYFGGSLGAVVSRRMSESVLRWTVIACGLAVTVGLFVS